MWWARGDLNPGPPPCKGGVLTRLDDGPTNHEAEENDPHQGVKPLRPERPKYEANVHLTRYLGSL